MSTYGDMLDRAMKIQTQEAAYAYFEKLVAMAMKEGKGRKEAESIQRSNLGYWAGYYDSETRERVERLFRCSHPIFGKIAQRGAPSMEEAWCRGRSQTQMNWTLDQLKQSKVGQMPSNQHLIEVTPGKFRDALLVADHPMHLEPQQIGTDDGLNKTERAYLEWLRTLGDTRIWVQSIGLKLSAKCFYYPDFAALDASGLRFIDTKACWKGQDKPHIEDDALVKLKWAAQLYAPCRFVVAWKGTDGTWKHKQIP